MDAFFFHPKLVHFPIAISVVMPFLAAGLLAAWWRNWLSARTWLVVVALQAALVASSVIALKAGEVEEERVEHVVAEEIIEHHEEEATIFLRSTVAVFVLMLIAFALSPGPKGRYTALVAVAGTVLVMFLGYKTGQSGGELVYTHGAANAYIDAGTSESQAQPAAAPEGDDASDE